MRFQDVGTKATRLAARRSQSQCSTWTTNAGHAPQSQSDGAVALHVSSSQRRSGVPFIMKAGKGLWKSGSPGTCSAVGEVWRFNRPLCAYSTRLSREPDFEVRPWHSGCNRCRFKKAPPSSLFGASLPAAAKTKGRRELLVDLKEQPQNELVIRIQPNEAIYYKAKAGAGHGECSGHVASQ